MFANLSRGSILHGIDKKGGMKWFTGSVERVIPSVSNQFQNPFGQFPNLTLDITVSIDGKTQEIKGIPSNNIIADFGDDSVILADNKDSLYNYVKSKLKESEDATNEENIKRHKKLIPQYKNVLAEMMPGVQSNNEVKELKEQVGTLQSQLAEALSLLKKQTIKED
jgi:hypothetical protein